MQALLEDTADQAKTPMGHWLEHAHDSLASYRDHHPARVSAGANDFSEVDQLAIVNVAVQVERLARHPILASAATSGAIQVVGMFFDFATAHVYEVDRSGLVHPAEPADMP
jgi:carbonic anhydrase